MKSASTLRVALFLILIPGVASANAGLPMIALTMPLMAVSLIPVVAIEAFILSRGLDLIRSRAIWYSLGANLVTMLVGVPLTWLLLVFLQMVTGGGSAYGIDTFLGKFLAVTWQAPWLIPYEPGMNWMAPIAMLVLLVPFFLMSWWIETKLLTWWTRENPNHVRTVCLKANSVTYLLMAIFVVAVLNYDTWWV